MANVYRLDRGELRKPTKLSNGWMRIDGRITRTGVFTYRMPDGKVRRELRLPDEVFKEDAMQSFALVPVTDEHPPVMLDASNTKEHARGSVAGTLRKDGEFVAGELLITDADLIKKLEDGKAREISCGYNCDLDETPGVTPSGLRYDAIQRNIRGNHVAIVPKGRAGPEARVRMDGAGVEMDGDDDQPRDEDGKWSSSGGGGGAKLRTPKSKLSRLPFPKAPEASPADRAAMMKARVANAARGEPTKQQEAIASKHLGFSTLKSEGSDSKDFKEASRTGLERAVQAANPGLDEDQVRQIAEKYFTPKSEGGSGADFTDLSKWTAHDMLKEAGRTRGNRDPMNRAQAPRVEPSTPALRTPARTSSHKYSWNTLKLRKPRP